jgi:hypothetical protein
MKVLSKLLNLVRLKKDQISCIFKTSLSDLKNLLYILLFVPFTFLGQTFPSIEQDIPLELQEGWNLFGFTCLESINVISAFSLIEESVLILKDNGGNTYLPEWNFNGIGDLQYSIGYQIKLTQEITDFQFCPAIVPLMQGCMEVAADNYNSQAVIADYCQYLGCMDAMAGNYNPQANEDDGSCAVAEACPYDIYVEYSADALNYNANLCQTLIVYGCTDYIAENYNNQANTEDQSCTYIWACTDSNADNYNASATQDDGTCIYFGCMDVLADNYNPQANQEDFSCIYYGCMNPTADNYDSQSNQDDGNCVIYGCILDIFPNYNSEATIDDFSCDMSSTDVFGCTNPNYLEYDPSVNQDNGTCSVLVVYGCTGADHCNYNPQANTDDGSCIYPQEGYDCDGNSLQVLIGALMNGGIVFYIDETAEHGLVAAMEDIEGTYEWGCYQTNINGNNPGVSPELQAIGTGYQNTLDIVSGCSETPIAASEALAYESEGYSDWYLPSSDELFEMYNTIGNAQGNIGGFSSNWYWSSSEGDNHVAWGVSFGSGVRWWRLEPLQ